MMQNEIDTQCVGYGTRMCIPTLKRPANAKVSWKGKNSRETRVFGAHTTLQMGMETRKKTKPCRRRHINMSFERERYTHFSAKCFAAWRRFNMFCPAKSSGHVETRTVRLDKNGITGVFQTNTQQPEIFSYATGPTQNVPDSFRRLKRWKVSVGKKNHMHTYRKTRQMNGVILPGTRNAKRLILPANTAAHAP